MGNKKITTALGAISLAVVAFAVAGCSGDVSSSSGSSSSSSSSSSSLSTYDIDDVTVDSINEAIDNFSLDGVKSLKAYDKTYGYQNSLVENVITYYQDGAVSRRSNLDADGVLAYDGDEISSGTLYSLPYDGEYNVLLYVDGEDEASNTLDYKENTPWIGVREACGPVAQDVYYLGSYWGNLDAYAAEYTDFEFEVHEEGDVFVAGVYMSAPGNDYMGESVIELEIRLNKVGLLIEGFTYLSYSYNVGTREDIENNCSYLTSFRVSDIVYGQQSVLGEVFGQGTYGFDDVPSENISNTPASIQQFDDGDLSEEDVLSILDNFEAYVKGTKSVSGTCYTENLLGDYDDNFNPIYVGETTWTVESTRYLGYNTVSERSYDFAEEGYQDYTATTHIYAVDAGLETRTTYTNGAEDTFTSQPGVMISSAEDQFNPHPFYTETEVIFLIADIGYTGFGTSDTGFSVLSATLNSATKSGNTITVDISYSFSSPYGSSDTKDWTFTIVDDFVTKTSVSGEDQNELTYTREYTAVKGDFEAYEE